MADVARWEWMLLLLLVLALAVAELVAMLPFRIQRGAGPVSPPPARDAEGQHRLHQRESPTACASEIS